MDADRDAQLIALDGSQRRALSLEMPQQTKLLLVKFDAAGGIISITPVEGINGVYQSVWVRGLNRETGTIMVDWRHFVYDEAGLVGPLAAAVTQPFANFAAAGEKWDVNQELTTVPDLPLDVVGRALQKITADIDPVFRVALEKKTTAYLARSSPAAAAAAAVAALDAEAEEADSADAAE